MRFELFRTSSANALAQLGGGVWGWRLVDEDGRALAHGLGYPTREACGHAIEALKRTTREAPRVDDQSVFANWTTRGRAHAGRA